MILSLVQAVQHQRINVSGRVQGVGFRPFVYQLATALGLQGTVLNTPNGVTIHVQGQGVALQKFQQALTTQAPSQARIEALDVTDLAPADFPEGVGFVILPSQTDVDAQKCLQISPDLGVCETCLAEFYNPESRRYLDPFINCTDCGPRFSILYEPMFDRQRSSMAAFPMCEACQDEFLDPSNRRFHSQGICCPNCEPSLTLYDAQQNPTSTGVAAIQQVASHLKQAGLVAFKGIGGFHLLCDATDIAAVAKLRQRKRRSRKPFAVLCADLNMALSLAELTAHEIELLTAPARPIVLVKPRQNNLMCDLVAPDIDLVGIMLAYSPLQHLLFEFIEFPLVATSANISGEPILFELAEVFQKLCRPEQPIADWVLDSTRDIVNPCDDSIQQSIDGKTMTLRLGRGLAPYYLPYFPQASALKTTVLAVGAQQKTSFAVGMPAHICMWPYLGDLGTFSALQRFEQQVQLVFGLCQTEASVYVADAHPHYDSRLWAEKQAETPGIRIQTVQHHYAHVLAGMAEHHLAEPVLGFSWDGTGYGDDGQLWGGEVLLADIEQYQRVFSLKPFKMLGGEQAALQPRRLALALLFEVYSLDEVLDLVSPTVDAFSDWEIRQLHQMFVQNINSPLSSSIGRVFDAVASLLGLVQQLDYEGESGLRLASLYDESITESYDLAIVGDQMDWQTMLQQLLQDLQQGTSLRQISSRFINMWVNFIERVAMQYPQHPVVVSGGVFQNKALLGALLQRFQTSQRTCYFQQQTPLNDGGIALGQVWATLKSAPSPENEDMA